MNATFVSGSSSSSSNIWGDLVTLYECSRVFMSLLVCTIFDDAL